MDLKPDEQRVWDGVRSRRLAAGEPTDAAEADADAFILACRRVGDRWFGPGSKPGSEPRGTMKGGDSK